LLQVRDEACVKWRFKFVRATGSPDPTQLWEAVLRGRKTINRANTVRRPIAQFGDALAAAIAAERAVELLRFRFKEDTIAKRVVLADQRVMNKVSKASSAGN
jgi:hypothetical protein